MVPVALLGRPLARGEAIGPDDIIERELPVAALPADALRSAEQLVDHEATHALSADRVLRAGDVATPWLVRRGDAVTMLFTRGALQITGTGTALDDGRQGRTVRVQLAAGGEVRKALVVGPRRVEVGPSGSASTDGARGEPAPP
jgi:flagella basal body P-ring formation protein FlgA